jgi:hypothetical protein
MGLQGVQEELLLAALPGLRHKRALPGLKRLIAAGRQAGRKVGAAGRRAAQVSTQKAEANRGC